MSALRACIICAGLLAVLGPGAVFLAAEGAKEEDGFVALFDGKSLEGWHPVSAPGHGSGGIWDVKDGTIDGLQSAPGSWSMLATAKRYGDFELRFEVRSDGPIEAGVLLRTTMEAHGYQVPLQIRSGGDVGGITVSKIGDFEVLAKDGLKAWKKDGWNEVRITVEGTPPMIRTWINGKAAAEAKVELKDSRVGPEGHIALEIRGPQACFQSHVAYRNIRIRELKK